MNKKLIAALCAFSLSVSMVGCSAKNTNSASENTDTSINENIDIQPSESLEEVDTYIELGDTVSINGEGATVNDNIVTITSGGVYSISGELKDGQIVVSSSKEEKVQIQLNNANITCSNSAPINIKSAKKATIGLVPGTQNTLTDGENYIFEDETTDEPNATLFSKDDLTIIGSGELVVNANYNNGITSKDDLKIEGGNITVNSVADGLRGKDSIKILDGQITIDAKEDGMKSSNTEDPEKGYIQISGGTINITSGQDGIQAETNLIITNGDINIVSGEGSENSSKSNSWGNWGNMNKPANNMQPPNMNNTTGTTDTTQESDTTSAKGIKAASNITISGGKINIDSSDDSIHSNNNIKIDGGTMNLASGDDGIHSDNTIEINDGDISITKSYEGIESQSITINGGNISVVSSDDGINAGGGSDNSSTNGRPGENSFNTSNECEININGGYIVVDASGDGIDANGSITMTNGTVIVNGPENNGNGALDYDKSCNISGGILIAAGSVGMAQSPSSTSTQNSVNIALSSQSANTIIHVEDELGNEVITFAPSKQYQSVVISSPNLKTGSTYKVYYGGISTGESKGGLYTGGKYSTGEESTSFIISETITNLGSSGSMGGANGGMNGQMGGGKGNKPDRNNSQQPPTQNSTTNNNDTL